MRLADLEQCNFDGADLTNAVLEGAAVNAAEFSDTTVIEVRRARTRPPARPHGAAADSVFLHVPRAIVPHTEHGLDGGDPAEGRAEAAVREPVGARG